MANKFWKKAELSAVEQQVGVALTQIQQQPEFKEDLKNFYISSVVDYTNKINSKKNVYVVLIPYPCLRIYQKLSAKLIPQLEKNLKATIFVAAKRKIESRWIKTHRSQKRAYSRTLTAVYEALLEDLLTPANVLGKRTRVRVDGTRFYRIFLDQNDQKEVESRAEIVKSVYKVLTTRDIEFEFKQDDTFFQTKKNKAQSKQK